MKKAIGVVIGIVIALGLAFGVREVIANRAEQHPKTEAVAKMDSGSQPKVSSSSTSSSSKPKKQSSSNQPHHSKSKHQAAHHQTADQASSITHTPKKAAAHHATAKRSSTAQHPKATAKKQTATTHRSTNTVGKAYLKVSGYKKLFYSGNLNITKKTTAFALLKQTNLKITYTSSPAIYVSAINGLKENDIKPGSGWMYSVNGKYVDKSAGDKLIKPGDQVHWYFTVNRFSE